MTHYELIKEGIEEMNGLDEIFQDKVSYAYCPHATRTCARYQTLIRGDLVEQV